MKTGITANLERRTVSGARVMFDARTTADANNSRDYTNRKRPQTRKAKRNDENETET